VTTVHSVGDYVADFHRQHLLGGKPGEGRPGLVMIPDVVSTVPPGIPHPRATASEHPSLAGLPDQPFILFVGALTANKGIGPLLKAYDLLPSPPPLVLIGTTWPDTPSTFAEGVTVLHDVPHDAVMQAWERCLFGVVPSTWAEPWGGVVFEAMTSGKAVIVSRVGGMVVIVVDGQTGLIVPPGDPAALAAAMRRLLEDPDLRQSLGRGGRARAELFGADIIMPQFEELYRDLVTRTRAR
jgi:glycosyltransferase involved in cell wall biosynthesis